MHINNKFEIHTSLNYLVFLTTNDGNIYDHEFIHHTKFTGARNDTGAGLQLSGLEDEVQDEEHILAAHQGMISGTPLYIYLHLSIYYMSVLVPN